MGQAVEIKVPDIGDFEDVEVVELLVAKGDEVAFDDPLVSIESDKATMEIPSTAAGTVESAPASPPMASMATTVGVLIPWACPRSIESPANDPAGDLQAAIPRPRRESR